ncbi:MAG: metallophosphoesterase [Isosphaeraceae bacterium]
MVARFRRVVHVLMLLLIAGPAAPRALADDPPGQFLVISDIHFDPFFDAALFPRLVAEPADRWGEVLRAAAPAGLNPRGTDSNDALLQGSLDDARARCPSPAFVLYPGDFMAHGWQEKYDRLAARSHLEDPDAYRAFTTKAIRYLAAEFRRRFADVPVLPTLGNDDSYCGDYLIEPAGPFLAMFAEAWAPLLGPRVDPSAFRETFGRGGYFSTPLPGLKDHRLIVLNSVYCSVNYDNACGRSIRTPALDQFRWLEQALAQSRAAGESVWLLTHISPGINSYNSAEEVARGGSPVTFWQPELRSRFLQLVREYRSTLRIAFTGHTHMDDFRVLRLDGEPVLPIKIAPAVSPIFGNNPGYQVYQFDRATGRVLNYQTYYLTNLPDAGRPAPSPVPGRWAVEYDFRAAYGLAELSARAFARLADTLTTDAETARRYSTYYGVSAPPEFDEKSFPIYRCAIANVTPSEFLRCLTGSPEPKAPLPHPDRKRPAQPAAR